MKVVVEILTGNLFCVQVGNDATVGDLKREIGAQQELPQDRLFLILDKNNQTSDPPLMGTDEEGDGASLSACGVQDGSHIYLFFYPLDDAPSNANHFLFNDF